MSAPSAAAVDRRRINETDADYQRLHHQAARRLMDGLREYARALATVPPHEREAVASRFISQQVTALRAAYLAAHWQGERDYWGAHSAPSMTAAAAAVRHLRLSRACGVTPDHAALNRTLGFYAAASVTKMAREAMSALAAYDARRATLSDPLSEPLTETTTAPDALSGPSGGVRLLAGGGLPPELAQWLDGLTARVGAQADIVWPGLQNGYVAAGGLDPANPYEAVWWELEPTAQHCRDCPAMAAQSPFSAPGSGWLLGNELWITPGDGTTECGAGCKCTLRYGPPTDGPQTKPAPAPITQPLDVPIDDAATSPAGDTGPEANTEAKTEANTRPQREGAPSMTGTGAVATPPTPTTPPTIPDWTTAQVRALDAARAALIGWDRVRGDLPRLSLFASDDADLAAVLQAADDATLITEPDALTTQQQQALVRFAAARAAYRKQVLAGLNRQGNAGGNAGGNA